MVEVVAVKDRVGVRLAVGDTLPVRVNELLAELVRVAVRDGVTVREPDSVMERLGVAEGV